MSEQMERKRVGLSATLFPETIKNAPTSYYSHGNFRKKNHANLEQECLIFMANHEFSIDKLNANDMWQRLSVDGENDEDEWYRARSGISIRGNPWLMCTFGTWAGGFKVFGTFKSWDNDDSLLSDEVENISNELSVWESQNKEFQREEKKQKIQKAVTSWEISSEEPFAQHHLHYLNKKLAGRYGIRFGERIFNDGSKEKPVFNRYPTLVIPIRDIDGNLQAIQHIREDGLKRFDGVSKGGYHILGAIDSNSPIFVAEGYATASSIHQAKGYPTVVAFNCGNLESVVCNLREKYPKHRIIIAADNDIETTGNPGRTKAEATAEKFNCKVIYPVFPEDFKLPHDQNGISKCPTDWNDLHVYFGIEKVQKQLPTFEKPKPCLITLTHSALIQKEIPPRKFVLKPWLPEAAISMVFAPPGVGKSYLCLAASGVIASGGKMFKSSPWEAPEPKKVLYIDGEMHEADLQTRVKKLMHEYAMNIPNDYLRYLNGSWQPGFIPDLSGIEGQKSFFLIT